VLFFGSSCLYVAVGVIALIGLYEFYKAMANKGYKPFCLLGFFWTIFIFLMLENGIVDKIIPLDKKNFIFGFFFFITFSAMLIILVIKYKQYSFVDISITIFGVFYVSYLFSFIPALRFAPNGEYMVYIVFLGAWVTDTGGYFAGRFFGKRKIVPLISPKKTVEGSIGGVIACVVSITTYGYLLIQADKVSTSLFHFVILGLICSVFSQLGDWIASAIKRYTDMKDFGKIMPGHGGVLDRFDSIIFIAPFVYYYIVFFVNKTIF
jgi:phosphatidate cytidylyltransferase